MAKITVFGGSTPRPGDPAYQDALILGQTLAKNGHTVLTGGYIGTMEAISRGAAEAGGHVIGITCDEIETWRPVKPNPWIIEEIRYPRLRDRLYGLIDLCDAALALPGGIGTLAEISVLWSQLQTRSSSPRPFILIGSGWLETIKTFTQSLDEYVHAKDQHLLAFAPDTPSAVEKLQVLLASA
jgi:uncharacterized protein (TIGR00730 family)